MPRLGDDVPQHQARRGRGIDRAAAHEHVADHHVVVDTAAGHRGVRPHAVNVELASRMGVDLDDRGLRLVAAVWGSIIMAALADLGMDTEWRGVDIDDAADRIEETFVQFAGLIDGVPQPV
ncbi:MAG: hypothetical protein QOJ24_5103 [Mycobacterium sp.]|nr:hypothetical protein [Mycobacterium sp.]